MILTEFAEHLLTMLVGERSLAINRAAMASSELAEVLLAAGRFTAGPIVEKYLARLDDTAALQILNPAAAFRQLYGLVQDTQIRTQATSAVDVFLRLNRPQGGQDGSTCH